MTPSIDYAINPPASASGALASWLAAPPQGHSAWLLIDVAAVGADVLARACLQFGWAPQNAFARTALAIYGDHAPHLIALQPNDASLAGKLGQLMAARPVPAYSGLMSALPIESLRPVLAYLGRAIVDDEAMYCRFADTRVLPALLKRLTPQQAAKIAPAIAQWCWIDPLAAIGVWQNAPPEPKAPRPVAPEDRSIHLSPAQFAGLLRAAEPDAIFAQLLDVVSALVPASGRGDFRGRLDAMLQAADGYEIEGNPDRLQFVVLSLTCGERFHRHPLLQDMWKAVRAKTISLSAAMAQWAPSTWAALGNQEEAPR
jgi:hypothetical protein